MNRYEEHINLDASGYFLFKIFSEVVSKIWTVGYVLILLNLNP